MDPRYSLFKGVECRTLFLENQCPSRDRQIIKLEGFFDETTLPTGEIRVAVRYADVPCPQPPSNPTPVLKLDAAGLPRPTEDLDQVRRDVKEWGYGLIANVMSHREVHVMEEALR